MELTGLRAIVNNNNGGNFTDNTGTQSNSKTLGYKQINNLPKFEEGTPGMNTGLSLMQTKTPSLISPDGFGGSNYKTPIFTPHIDWGNSTQRAMALGQTGALANSIGNDNPIDLNKSNQMLSKSIGSTLKGGSGGKGFTAGKGFNVGGVGNLVTSGIKFTGDAINAFSTNETGEEITARQGSSQMSIGGVGFESQNSIDISKELESVKKQNVGNTLATVGSGAGFGAAVGSVIPGLGTAAGAVIGAGVGLITGIFGSEARKRKYRRMMEEQNAKINALQNSARYSAQTKAIQLQNAREYGDTETQYLYGAKNGMLPKYNNGTPSPDLSNIQEVKPGQKLADSTFGKVNAFNSYASNGEVAVEDDVMHKLGKGKDNNDTLPFFATGKTAIFPNKGEEKYGIDISDFVWKTGDVNTGLLMLKDYQQNMNKNSMYAKNGRLPRYAGGRITFNPNDLILDDATLADIKKLSSRKEDPFISPLEIMKQNAIGASQQNIDNWKNSIAPIDSKSPVGGLVDPYAINKNLKSPTGEESYGNNDNNSVGKWFTSPLDNLPYYFNMGAAALHGLFRDRRIHMPQTKVAMPEGLDELYALKMNPYPIMQNNIKIQDKMKKAVQMSGGLNAAQKALAYMAAQYNTQLNNSKVSADAQIQDNAYASDATKTRLNAMAAYDQRRVAQDNYRDDTYARGHANNQKMDVEDWTTFSTAWQNANKNTFNSNVYRWMMDQYAQEQKAKRKNGRWII